MEYMESATFILHVVEDYLEGKTVSNYDYRCCPGIDVPIGRKSIWAEDDMD